MLKDGSWLAKLEKASEAADSTAKMTERKSDPGLFCSSKKWSVSERYWASEINRQSRYFRVYSFLTI